MFHLLVAYQGWANTGGSIPNGRVYIKADQEPGRRFYRNGKLNTSKMAAIPALLVTETGGNGPQYARIAYLTKIIQDASQISIQYAVDGSMPTISNADLQKHSALLGIGKYSLTHTHWRICDADLFRLLLANQQRNTVTPKVFSASELGSKDPNLVSVMMPFNAGFKAVYSTLQSAVKLVGLECVRADDIWEDHVVIQDIVNIIARARVVICDCSGKNPNVFYEIGIAHAFGKDVILITQSDEDVPFDLKHLRYIRYLSNAEGLQDLAKAVQLRLETLIS